MARTDPQLNIRCPQDLRDKLEFMAKENNRSLTAEVVSRLEDSFDSSSNDGLVSTLNEHLAHMAEQNNTLLNEIKLMRNQMKSM